jgi:hypothetical protein
VDKLTIFPLAKTIDFQNDECFTGELEGLLEPFGGGTVALYSSENENHGFSFIYVHCDGEDMGGFEMFLFITPNQWLAVISACEHPSIHSNVFDFEHSDGDHWGFEFQDDGEATTAIECAEKWYNEFCNYFGEDEDDEEGQE